MRTITFAEPRMLWLLIAPVLLLALWVWRSGVRRVELRRLQQRRVIPGREHYATAGELLLWLAIVIAAALLVVALARPGAPTTLPLRAGLDLIILQDASASMRVADTGADRFTERWQRSMEFLRELGDALSWTNDRLAMIAFAHIATPQIRLTRDPNTLFFFLDHLHARPPFRLEDDETWDTNLEEAIAWGLRVVDKNEEIHGRSANATVFLMLSDGEAWSGEVAKAVARTAARDIPLYVIGVGTLGGAPLPAVRTASGELLDSPGLSRLERASLQRIARGGHGDYIELDRDGDRNVANAIVAAGRRRAPAIGMQQVSRDLYWWLLLAAALTAAAGLVFVRHAAEAGVLLAGAVGATVVLAPLLW
jgi:Ca-activated chloride channel family protein